MTNARMLIAAALGTALLGCLPAGSGSGASTASVSGTAAGSDFSFSPGEVGADFTASGSDEGELTVHLCESGCAALGGSPGEASSRQVTLLVAAATADLRSGATFAVGAQAAALAQIVGTTNRVDEARSGEVVIESSDLREGGRTVGTFQLELASGGSINGFFDAPLVSVSGPVVVLGP